MIVAVLGGGKLGEAVAKRISESKKVSKVIMTKRDISTVAKLASSKLDVTKDNRKAVGEADVIIVSVKAGDAKALFKDVAPLTKGKLVISLMAAVSIEKIQLSLPHAKVTRAMPNVAATIGEAITAYSPSPQVTPKDIETVEFILGCFGTSIQVPESLMNAVTALSGSGPAYIAILIESMVSAGLMVGMPRDVALKLATKTLVGTADLLEHTKLHPSELRDSVTTPAGTTIAGIYELEKGAFRTSVMNAVEAATRASERVAKKFDAEH